MSCVTKTVGSLPALNDWKGLEPVCKIPPQKHFKKITCPLQTHYRKSKLCDLLPPDVTNSIIDFLANLPIILLFIASVPARIIYCIVYNFLINYDSILKAFQYSVINVGLDFMTNPLVYIAIGLADGENNASFSIPYLVGIIDHACMPSILQTIYQYVGSVFYFLGYALGFVLGLFIDLYDIILYSICSFITFSFSFGLCLSYDIIDVFQGQAGVVLTIYPFSFLADFLKNVINCGCVLGSYPNAFIGFCINFGGSCPSCCPCGIGFTPPSCPPIPNTTPPTSSSLTFTFIASIINFAESIVNELKQDIQNVSNYAHDIYNDLTNGLNDLKNYVESGFQSLEQDIEQLASEITGHSSESSS